MTNRAMTLRLPVEQAAQLEAIAKADEQPISEAVRVAIDEHIERRRDDKEFQARLRAMMKENQEVLRRLAQ